MNSYGSLNEPKQRTERKMKRTVEVEMTIRTNKVEKAINKFFSKHPELEYWKETFEYMAENNESFFSDYYFDTANRVRNENWAYALHLDINENINSKNITVYMCVIERA